MPAALTVLFLIALVLFCPIADARDPDAVKFHIED
jgi:hypothetical protein